MQWIKRKRRKKKQQKKEADEEEELGTEKEVEGEKRT